MSSGRGLWAHEVFSALLGAGGTLGPAVHGGFGLLRSILASLFREGAEGSSLTQRTET